MRYGIWTEIKSAERLLTLEDGQVSFRWKDYRHPQRSKVMTLSAEEFIRRFLLHSVPPHFQRIRYYGLFAHCHRSRKLEVCRQRLATPISALLPHPADYRDFYAALTARSPHLCPQCGLGNMISIETLAPYPNPVLPCFDTS